MTKEKEKFRIVLYVCIALVLVSALILVTFLYRRCNDNVSTPSQATPDFAKSTQIVTSTEESKTNTAGTNKSKSQKIKNTEQSMKQPGILIEFLSQMGYSIESLENNNCSQLIVVKSSGSEASIYYFYKEGKVWFQNEMLTTSGFVGRNGTAPSISEGANATPQGMFPIGEAFYINDEPKTGLSIFKITENTYWIDDPTDEDYNTRVESETDRQGEHMIDYSPCYDYGFVIKQNMDPIIPDAGSAIFFHYNNRPTAGCVATSTEMVLEYLEVLSVDRNPYILII